MERKFLFFKMHSYYFSEKNQELQSSKDIEGFSHSTFSSGLLKVETSCIDLTREEELLFFDLRSSNRKQIRRAMNREFIIEELDNPTIRDIYDFQRFYNAFAKTKDTYSCNAFHINTMKRLRNQNALVITKILNNDKETLCYRVYISDGENVLSLYSASYYKEFKSAIEKRMLSEASRYLLWHNILYFKRTNHKRYDMGGLTDNENIRNFKLEFGGDIVEVYSGYKAKSSVGKIVLWGRNLYMRR
ncbi:hypothetical protein GI482_02705 [Bacillus sp. N3536]|nr:hypothetical protein GI482_02705 [Bacillus sp. N3536]